MVMMMRLITDARLAGRIASRYMMAPTAAAESIEMMKESGIESPADAASVYDSIPPSIKLSLGEVYDAGNGIDYGETKPYEGINAAIGESLYKILYKLVYGHQSNPKVI